jgi:hypothetical protein
VLFEIAVLLLGSTPSKSLTLTEGPVHSNYSYISSAVGLDSIFENLASAPTDAPIMRQVEVVSVVGKASTSVDIANDYPGHVRRPRWSRSLGDGTAALALGNPGEKRRFGMIAKANGFARLSTPLHRDAPS